MPVNKKKGLMPCDLNASLAKALAEEATSKQAASGDGGVGGFTVDDTAASSAARPPGICYDEYGLPCAPGADGADERHPFSFLDPDDVEHDDIERQLKPADLMHFVCLAGCRHFVEFLDEEPDPVKNRKAIHRMCMRFYDDEGQWYLTERTAYACTEFSPPWWSLLGQARRVVNWVEIMHARGAINEGMQRLPSIWLAGHLASALKHIGIDVTRGADVELKSKIVEEEEY